MGLSCLRLVVFALNILAIYHTGYGCSVPRYWRSKGASIRAVHADIVMVGKVVYSPYQKPPTRQSPQFGPYDVRFRVICALKGRLRAKYVNVSDFGYIPGHCVSSRALQNETYITFLRKRRGRYFVAEINGQDGTIPFKKSIFRKVVKKLRRNGDLNKSRDGCVQFVRTKRKSAKKSGSAFEKKSQLSYPTATKSSHQNTALTASNVGRNGGLWLKSSWAALIMVGIHCVGSLLT